MQKAVAGTNYLQKIKAAAQNVDSAGSESGYRANLSPWSAGNPA